jgi:small subunit ribosomal protein S9
MAAAKKRKAKKKEECHVYRGKRKSAIARAAIGKGKGTVRINSVNINAIDNRFVRDAVSEPLKLAPEVASAVDISVSVSGGGAMGQAQACRVAVARALVGFSGSGELKQRILQHDRFMYAEDFRRTEPKKYKGPKARARFQKSYR